MSPWIRLIDLALQTLDRHSMSAADRIAVDMDHMIVHGSFPTPETEAEETRHRLFLTLDAFSALDVSRQSAVGLGVRCLTREILRQALATWALLPPGYAFDPATCTALAP